MKCMRTSDLVLFAILANICQTMSMQLYLVAFTWAMLLGTIFDIIVKSCCLRIIETKVYHSLFILILVMNFYDLSYIVFNSTLH